MIQLSNSHLRSARNLLFRCFLDHSYNPCNNFREADHNEFEVFSCKPLCKKIVKCINLEFINKDST